MATQKGPWQAVEDTSQRCLKELEQPDKSQFCDPQRVSPDFKTPIAAGLQCPEVDGCRACAEGQGKPPGARRETLAPSLLLKPGEDIVTTVINFCIMKQIKSMTVAVLCRAMAHKWTQPKIFNRMKSVQDHYFTTDNIYQIRSMRSKQVQKYVLWLSRSSQRAKQFSLGYFLFESAYESHSTYLTLLRE